MKDGELVTHTWTVPADEVWYLVDYKGTVTKSIGGSGTYTAWTIQLRVYTPNRNLRSNTELLSDNQNDTGSSNSPGGVVGMYLYPGETVEVWESSDDATGSEGKWWFAMRRME